VEDGLSGFLFDSGNPADLFPIALATGEGLEKLKRLLGPALWRETGSNARKIFEERFAVGRMVGEYKDISTV